MKNTKKSATVNTNTTAKKEESVMKSVKNTTAAKKSTTAAKSATNTKEESVMKKSTKSAVNTNTQNTITINGITIPLTEEQSALLAASLMFPAPSTKAVKSAKAVTVANSAADDVKPATAEKVGGITRMKKSATTTTTKVESAADEDKLTDFADFEVQIDGNKLSFTAPEGKFLAYKTARYALNNRLKAVCKEHAFNCVYNDKVWAWELKTMLGKPLGKVKMAAIKAAVEAPVTVAELEDVRDRWSKKSSR